MIPYLLPIQQIKSNVSVLIIGMFFYFLILLVQ